MSLLHRLEMVVRQIHILHLRASIGFDIALVGGFAHCPFTGASTPFVRGSRMLPMGRRSPRPCPAVAVPRILYRNENKRYRRWMWIDLWNYMYRERIIFLYKPIDDYLGNQLVATLLYLDAETPGRDIFLYINCSGGQVIPTLALHDTMRHIQSDVGAVAFGGAVGMAGFLLSVAKKVRADAVALSLRYAASEQAPFSRQGKRIALKNTQVMLHHPSGFSRGQASNMSRESVELLNMRDYMNAMIAQVTDKDLDRVEADFEKPRFFSAEEAKEYGLLDMVLQPPPSKGDRKREEELRRQHGVPGGPGDKPRQEPGAR